MRRRSPRSRPEDPYDLPDSSKESGAQDATAEPTEVEEPVLDDPKEIEFDPGSDIEPQPGPEPELSSPARSAEASEDNEAEIELPVLPNTNASKLSDVRPPSRRAQQNTEDLLDGGQSVRMSEAVSSTTRLHTTLQQDDDMPASSSPLVRKVRRSEGPATIRSRMSQMRTAGTPEPAEDMDELSPDRPDHAPADDELSEPNTVEEADPEVEPIDEEPVAEVEEAQEEEEVEAEAIDAVEAAKTIGRKRPRRSLPSQSPEAEPEEQADDDEHSPKRRRERLSRSPATQKQPATRPKASTTAKSRTGPKPLPKQVRKTKQAAKERRISDGTAIELTVHRFVNVKKFIKDDGEADHLAADLPFISSGETVVDVFSQVCLEVIEGTVAKLLQTLGTTEDKEKKKECRIKIRALEAYKEELNSRLLQLVSLQFASKHISSQIRQFTSVIGKRYANGFVWYSEKSCLYEKKYCASKQRGNRLL